MAILLPMTNFKDGGDQEDNLGTDFSANHTLKVGRILLPAIIYNFSFYCFQPTKLLLAALGPPDSMLERQVEVRLRAIGERIHVLSVLDIPHSPPTWNYCHPPTLPTQSLQPVHSLPIGPRYSPLLTSLTLSETLSLPIITFPAETVEGWY